MAISIGEGTPDGRLTIN